METPAEGHSCVPFLSPGSVCCSTGLPGGQSPGPALERTIPGDKLYHHFCRHSRRAVSKEVGGGRAEEVKKGGITVVCITASSWGCLGGWQAFISGNRASCPQRSRWPKLKARWWTPACCSPEARGRWGLSFSLLAARLPRPRRPRPPSASSSREPAGRFSAPRGGVGGWYPGSGPESPHPGPRRRGSPRSFQSGTHQARGGP